MVDWVKISFFIWTGFTQWTYTEVFSDKVVLLRLPHGHARGISHLSKCGSKRFFYHLVTPRRALWRPLRGIHEFFWGIAEVNPGLPNILGVGEEMDKNCFTIDTHTKNVFLLNISFRSWHPEVFCKKLFLKIS